MHLSWIHFFSAASCPSPDKLCNSIQLLFRCQKKCSDPVIGSRALKHLLLFVGIALGALMGWAGGVIALFVVGTGVLMHMLKKQPVNRNTGKVIQ
jgi:hypothetical protein